MIVGLDFDNTIISYEKIFYNIAYKKKLIPKHISKDKNTIKKYLIAKNLEDEWTIIQGEVYSIEIQNAKPYAGIFKFLEFLKKNNFKIYIVSHKTKYPYLGGKYNLHKSAREWIKKNNLLKFVSKNNIYFEDTINKKIDRIKSLKCNYFIDDLNKILDLLPKKIIKLLFDPYKKNSFSCYHSLKSWKEVIYYFNKELNYKKYSQIRNINQYILPFNNEGRNNKIYFIKENKKKLIIKFYKADKNRQERELLFLKYLQQNKLFFSNKIIHYDLTKNFSIFNYLPGNKVTKIYNYHIEDCVNFIYKINKKNNLNNKNFEFAVDYCDSHLSHVKGIGDRLNFVLSKTNKILSLKKYDNLFKNKILPIFNFQFKGLNKNFNNQIIKNKYKFSDYILSPSDFGFHNIIIKDKKCFFIDFEYSGFDDPHKLILDFICQPDFYLTKEKKNFFIKTFIYKFHNNNISKKLIYYLEPFYRIKWCCIMLNKYLNEDNFYYNQNKNLTTFNNDYTKINNYYKTYIKKYERN